MSIFPPENPWCMPYRVGKLLHLYRDCDNGMTFAAAPFYEINYPEDVERLRRRGLEICNNCLERVNETTTKA